MLLKFTNESDKDPTYVNNCIEDDSLPAVDSIGNLTFS